MKKYMTGGVANPNQKAAVQKVAGSKGVGTTKSKKQDGAQKTPGSKGAGTTHSQKAVVSPAKKKKQAK